MSERRHDDALDALLAEARQQRQDPGMDFLARLVGEAEAVQPRPVVAAPTTGWSGPRGWLRALGGWPALGGLTAAMVAGLWLGLSPPPGLSALAAEVTGVELDLGLYDGEQFLALLEG